jgi:hypothetical protein
MKKSIKRVINKLPYISRLVKQNKKLSELAETYTKFSFVPPGHYYSPIVNTTELKHEEDRIWPLKKKTPGNIDLNQARQLELLKLFSGYQTEMPFKDNQVADLRYYFNNSYFTALDGIVLYSFIRHFTPTKIIEIGSGFSSAVMMDTNQFFFNNKIKIDFIEPYPDRLISLMKKEDQINYTILPSRVQDVPLDFFVGLNENDILFIDSTHVCKTGSDLNYIYFEILPILKKGVIIHIHDIFYPFEYPKEWVYEGRNWNEIYLLQAFLLFNSAFTIEFFNNYLFDQFIAGIIKFLPVSEKENGGSIWLRKNI